MTPLINDDKVLIRAVLLVSLVNLGYWWFMQIRQRLFNCTELKIYFSLETKFWNFRHTGITRLSTISCYISALKKQSGFWTTVYIHCVSKKTIPFYFCNNFVVHECILTIFGESVAKEICNMLVFTYL